jgi:hypothetical protein
MRAKRSSSVASTTALHHGRPFAKCFAAYCLTPSTSDDRLAAGGGGVKSGGGAGAGAGDTWVTTGARPFRAGVRRIFFAGFLAIISLLV